MVYNQLIEVLKKKNQISVRPKYEIRGVEETKKQTQYKIVTVLFHFLFHFLLPDLLAVCNVNFIQKVCHLNGD